MLCAGTQVREEDFGLLFYTMQGPRLYFLSCRQLLGPSFFESELTLDQWARLRGDEPVSVKRMEGIRKVLEQLRIERIILITSARTNRYFLNNSYP